MKRVTVVFVSTLILVACIFPSVSEAFIWRESFNDDPFAAGRWHRSDNHTIWDAGGFIHNGTYHDTVVTYNHSFSTLDYTNLNISVVHRTHDAHSSRYMEVWGMRGGSWLHIGNCPSLAWDNGTWRTSSWNLSDGNWTRVRIVFRDAHVRRKDINRITITGTVIPEPVGLLALGSGLLGLAGFAIRRKRE